jgi:hypothetical protein
MPTVKKKKVTIRTLKQVSVLASRSKTPISASLLSPRVFSLPSGGVASLPRIPPQEGLLVMVWVPKVIQRTRGLFQKARTTTIPEDKTAMGSVSIHVKC